MDGTDSASASAAPAGHSARSIARTSGQPLPTDTRRPCQRDRHRILVRSARQPGRPGLVLTAVTRTTFDSPTAIREPGIPVHTEPTSATTEPVADQVTMRTWMPEPRRWSSGAVRWGDAALVEHCVRLLHLAPGAAQRAPSSSVAMASAAWDNNWLSSRKPRGHAHWARVWVARALRYVSRDSSSPGLAPRLGDEHWWVREMVAKVVGDREISEAVGRLGEGEHGKALLGASTDADRTSPAPYGQPASGLGPPPPALVAAQHGGRGASTRSACEGRGWPSVRSQSSRSECRQHDLSHLGYQALNRAQVTPYDVVCSRLEVPTEELDDLVRTGRDA